jgi:hypothetical protein
MDHEPRFDIFSGTVDKDARWIEAVPGLANARTRMESLAKPGKYFIFSTLSHAVLAMTDTTPLAKPDISKKQSDTAYHEISGLIDDVWTCEHAESQRSRK